MRLTLSYLAIFLLAEMVLGAGLWALLREGLFDVADDSLAAEAADLRRFLEAHKDAPGAQLQADLAANYKIERSRDCVQISDSAGNVIYRSRFLDQHPLAPITLGDPDRPVYQSRRLADERFRFISEQMDVEGRVFTVRIGRSMRDESDTLEDFRRYLFWFTALLLLVVSTIGHRLNRRALTRTGE
jgi:hypothetical protein